MIGIDAGIQNYDGENNVLFIVSLAAICKNDKKRKVRKLRRSCRRLVAGGT